MLMSITGMRGDIMGRKETENQNDLRCKQATIDRLLTENKRKDEEIQRLRNELYCLFEDNPTLLKRQSN